MELRPCGCEGSLWSTTTPDSLRFSFLSPSLFSHQRFASTPILWCSDQILFESVSKWTPKTGELSANDRYSNITCVFTTNFRWSRNVRISSCWLGSTKNCTTSYRRWRSSADRDGFKHQDLFDSSPCRIDTERNPTLTSVFERQATKHNVSKMLKRWENQCISGMINVIKFTEQTIHFAQIIRRVRFVDRWMNSRIEDFQCSRIDKASLRLFNVIAHRSYRNVNGWTIISSFLKIDD